MNYTLRRVASSGVTMNHALGNTYTVVGRAEAPEEFRRAFKSHFGKDHVADLDEAADDDTKNCIAFVSGRDGSYIQPIWTNQKNYIVGPQGKTLQRIR